MRKLVASISLALMILFGVATIASASPVPPPPDYGPALQPQSVAFVPQSPVPPPPDY
jgi:hypothetical protein